jgi:hypothetical protein
MNNKIRYIFVLSTLLVVLSSMAGFGQSVTSDSLTRYLLKHQESVHTIIDGYEKAGINWTQILTTLAGFIFFLGAAWKFFIQDWLKAYINKKAEELADNISNLKSTPILVVSSNKGKPDNDEFLQGFFEEKKINKTKFIRIEDNFVPVTDFRYKLVFINNDDGNIPQKIAEQYSDKEQPIFYFGASGSWKFQDSSVETNKQINLANSRAQIYGNLMSTLQFLSIIKPNVKNV